jgi:hypothetical protein
VCLWSLFNFNQPEWFNSITLTLINTARPANLNHDLKKWQDIVTAKAWTHPLPVRILQAKQVGSKTSWIRRGVIDYLLALKQCMEQESAWCLVIEEDMVLTRNFIAKFRNVMELSLSPDRVMRDRIGMVKFFVSDHWDGFSWSWTHVKDVAFVALLALMFLMGVLQFHVPGGDDSSVFSSAEECSEEMDPDVFGLRGGFLYPLAIDGTTNARKLLGTQSGAFGSNWPDGRNSRSGVPYDITPSPVSILDPATRGCWKGAGSY